jgi:hypothetical protein
LELCVDGTPWREYIGLAKVAERGIIGEQIWGRASLRKHVCVFELIGVLFFDEVTCSESMLGYLHSLDLFFLCFDPWIIG